MNDLRQVYNEQLDYIKHHHSFYTPVSSNEIDERRKILNTKVNDMYDFGLLTSLNLPQGNTIYDPIEPLKSDNPLDSLCYKNSRSSTEWYFLYGVDQTPGPNGPLPAGPKFTATLFRIGVSRSVSIYCLFIGYTVKDSSGNWKWYRVAGSYGYVDQLVTTCEEGKQLSILYNGMSKDDNGNVKRHTFGLMIGIDVGYMSGYYKGTNDPTMTFVLYMNGAKPYYNGKGGCMPICFDGVGSLYWSYPNLNFSSYSVDGQMTKTNGWSWVDHQWMTSGAPRSFFGKMLSAVTGGSSKPKMTRWLWTTAKISDKLLYMFYTHIDKYPAMPGDKFVCQINAYTPAGAQYNIAAETVINTVGNYPYKDYKYVFPVEYTINLSSDKKYQFSITPIIDTTPVGGTVIMGPDTLNWESAGMWTDEKGTTGLAFLEANNFHDEKYAVTHTLDRLGYDSKDKDKLEAFIPQPSVSSIRVFMWLLFVVVVLILGMIMVTKLVSVRPRSKTTNVSGGTPSDIFEFAFN